MRDSLWQLLDRIAVPAFALIGIVFGVMGWIGLAPLPGDAAVYWLNTPGDYRLGVYGYPPVLSQLLVPLRAVDAVALYVVGWEALCFASVGFALRRFAFVSLMLVPFFLSWNALDAFVAPVTAAMLGNVTMPMTAAIVLAVRPHRSAWFAVPILTKLTPGIGVLWFAFRREWRPLSVALVVTSVVVAVSFALDPTAWTAYLQFLILNVDADSYGPPIIGPPLSLRLVAAAGILYWGARTKRIWVVPIAAGVAVVGLYAISSMTAVASGAVALWLSEDRTDLQPVSGAASIHHDGLEASRPDRGHSSTGA